MPANVIPIPGYILKQARQENNLNSPCFTRMLQLHSRFRGVPIPVSPDDWAKSYAAAHVHRPRSFATKKVINAFKNALDAHAPSQDPRTKGPNQPTAAEQTANRSQFEARIAELMKKTAELEKKNADLTAANGSLAVETTQLKTSITSLVTKNTQLTDAKNTFVAENTKLKFSNHSLVAKNANLVTSNESLVAESTKLKTSNESLVAENTKFRAANDSLAVKGTQLKAARDTLVTENAKLKSIVDAHASENVKLKTTNEFVSAKNTELEIANRSLLAKQAELNTANEALVAKNKEYLDIIARRTVPPQPQVGNENNHETHQNSHVNAPNDALHNRLDALEATTALLVSRLNRSMKRDAGRTALNANVKRRKIQTAIDSKMAAITAEWGAKLERLQAAVDSSEK